MTYLVHLLIYHVILLVCCVVPALLLVDLLPQTVRTGPLGVVLVTLALGYFLGASWVSHNASRRRVFEDEGFFDALIGAVNEGRLYLSFLPVVGRLFGSRPTRTPSREPRDRRFDPPS